VASANVALAASVEDQKNANSIGIIEYPCSSFEKGMIPSSICIAEGAPCKLTFYWGYWFSFDSERSCCPEDSVCMEEKFSQVPG